MIHCCDDMDSGFHFPGSRPFPMPHVETVDRPSLFHLDARLGRSTVSTCGIGEGRDPGEMKASVHVVTTVCHGSVYVQSSVVITVSVCQCKPEL